MICDLHISVQNSWTCFGSVTKADLVHQKEYSKKSYERIHAVVEFLFSNEQKNSLISRVSRQQ